VKSPFELKELDPIERSLRDGFVQEARRTFSSLSASGSKVEQPWRRSSIKAHMQSILVGLPDPL
jgi:hypothetical protein